MSSSVTIPILALVVLLAAGCAGGRPASPASPSVQTGDSLPTPPPTCVASQPMEVRPDIAPGLGAGPVWMITISAGEWIGPDFLAKTIWIVDDAVQDQVRITGQRLNGDDVALFQGYREYTGDSVSPDGREIILGATHGRSTDRRGYVIYPTAGCWRFTAESGGQVIAEITQYLYDVAP